MHTVQMSLWVIGLLVALALLFDFMNGFHDAANSIATVVSTGVQAAPCRGHGGHVQRDRHLHFPPQGGSHGRHRNHRRQYRRSLRDFRCLVGRSPGT
jgi:hypothetical protein